MSCFKHITSCLDCIIGCLKSITSCLECCANFVDIFKTTYNPTCSLSWKLCHNICWWRQSNINLDQAGFLHRFQMLRFVQFFNLIIFYLENKYSKILNVFIHFICIKVYTSFIFSIYKVFYCIFV